MNDPTEHGEPGSTTSEFTSSSISAILLSMKRVPPLLVTLLLLNAGPAMAESFVVHEFRKMKLSDQFYAEGANFGDFNNNGTMDVVSGPFWYEGPDFTASHEIYPPQAFDPRQYSDCFLVFVHDFNDNGWDDVLVVDHPGTPAHWYENPQGNEGHWKKHLVHEQVGNESPALGDVDGDGFLELIFNTEKHFGYAKARRDDPTLPWNFVPVSGEDGWSKYTHGLGYGDIKGNGRVDLVTHNGWFEQPESLEGDPKWIFHAAEIGPGAQIFIHDVNGNGRNDLISSLNAHGWGLGWFQQEAGDENETPFSRHLLMGEKYRDSKYGVRFSQLHALALADIDGDGLQDIVTGKRFWAHGPEGDPEPNAPAVLYWFKTVRTEDGEVDFLPFEIDDDSGVGTQMAAGDLSGNGYPDIVVGNKKGTFLFLNEPTDVSREEWEQAQPQAIQIHRE